MYGETLHFWGKKGTLHLEFWVLVYVVRGLATELLRMPVGLVWGIILSNLLDNMCIYWIEMDNSNFLWGWGGLEGGIS